MQPTFSLYLLGWLVQSALFFQWTISCTINARTRVVQASCPRACLGEEECAVRGTGVRVGHPQMSVGGEADWGDREDSPKHRECWASWKEAG